MDCDAVRRQLDEGVASEALAAHLARCPACRVAVELDRRLATAVAALPRVRAPQELMVRVMAELRPHAPAEPSSRRLLLLRLRTWEAAWLGALFLILVAGVCLWGKRMAIADWHSATASLRYVSRWPGETVDEWIPGVTGWDSWESSMAGFLHEAAAAVANVPASWMLALLGFGISLLWLLSRHGDFGARREWEDAHA